MTPFDAHEGAAVGGRYVLGQLLGRGAAGEVRAAYDPVLQRGVAVKLLHADADEGLAPRARFALEAQLAAAISSPHAVAVFDFGEDEGTPYLVMEQMSGRTWADELREGRPHPRRVAEVLQAVLAALAAAHSSGIWHRDVKPANVMLAADGTAKLGDFGIAKSASASQVTQTGDVVGSFAYVSPERVREAPSGPAADIWAVGVMAYESLAGRRPFQGQTALAVVHAVLAADHPALGTLRPDLPAELTGLVERCLSVEPEDRPSAEELLTGFAAADLSTLANEEPADGLAGAADVATATAAMAPIVAGAPSEAGQSQRRGGSTSVRRAGAWTTRLRPPSRRQRVGLAALGAAAVLGAGAFAAGSRTGPDHGRSVARPGAAVTRVPVAPSVTPTVTASAATASPTGSPAPTATLSQAAASTVRPGPGRHGKGHKHHR